MSAPHPRKQTLASALFELPDDPGRGFRFVRRDRSDVFFAYTQLAQEARRRADCMRELGLGRGDRVVLVVAEPQEFVLTFLGTVLSGAIPVPVSPRSGFRDVDGYVASLAHITHASGAAAVFHTAENVAIVEQLVRMLREGGRGEGDAPRTWDVATCFVRDPVRSVPFSPRPEEICFLQFTSGSTSKPKGVMVTHANLVANARAFLGPSGLDRRDDDLGVSWLPLFHDMGLIGFILGTLICDIPVVILPTETFARSPLLWLETMTKYRGTITYAPNFAYQLVTKRVRPRVLSSLDLSTLRVAGCGAEPIQAQTLRDFSEKFRSAGFDSRAFLPSYGMAESTLAITFHNVGTPFKVDTVDAEELARGRATSSSTDGRTSEVMNCGRAFPHHECKVVNDDGESLGERQVGEVLARGPSVSPGYYNNPEATAQAFADGWLRTGDLGYFVGDELHVCGRVKDLIIIRGANHYPQDIEWKLGDLDGVRRGNVFAFGVDEGDGEQLVIVLEAARTDAERVRDAAHQCAVEHFGLTPREVCVVPVGTLPKTSSGKAQRRKAQRMYLRGEFSASP